MRTIALRNGGETLVDDDDYEWARHFKWRLHANGYVFYHTSTGGTVYLHTLVMEPYAPFYVDHRNRNKQDNRKRNLRLCTPAENNWNACNRHKGARFKGVGWCPKMNQWRASLQKHGKRVFRGYFDSEAAAAKAYNEAAKKHYGEFAYLNPL